MNDLNSNYFASIGETFRNTGISCAGHAAYSTDKLVSFWQVVRDSGIKFPRKYTVEIIDSITGADQRHHERLGQKYGGETVLMPFFKSSEIEDAKKEIRRAVDHVRAANKKKSETVYVCGRKKVIVYDYVKSYRGYKRTSKVVLVNKIEQKGESYFLTFPDKTIVRKKMTNVDI